MTIQSVSFEEVSYKDAAFVRPRSSTGENDVTLLGRSSEESLACGIGVSRRFDGAASKRAAVTGLSPTPFEVRQVADTRLANP